MFSVLGIWEKILAVLAGIGAVAAAVFYAMFRIQQGKADRLGDQVDRLEDDLDDAERINRENEDAYRTDREWSDRAGDVEDEIDKIADRRYNDIDPDGFNGDYIDFGEWDDEDKR